jgi:hypothetical protein
MMVSGAIVVVTTYSTRKTGHCARLVLMLHKDAPGIGVWVFPELYQTHADELKAGNVVTIQGRYMGLDKWDHVPKKMAIMQADLILHPDKEGDCENHELMHRGMSWISEESNT